MTFRSKSLQIYLREDILSDAKILELVNMAPKSRKQHLFRRMLFLGLERLVENGEVSKSLLDRVENEHKEHYHDMYNDNVPLNRVDYVKNINDMPDKKSDENIYLHKEAETFEKEVIKPEEENKTDVEEKSVLQSQENIDIKETDNNKPKKLSRIM